MEKHKCKLCFRSFANGRALGGHMRSHMLNLPVPPKPEQEEEEHPHNQLIEEAHSASSSSSSSSSDEEEEEGEEEDQEGEENSEKGLSYGLRDNPKRSVRLVDPEFSFAVDAGSVVLQDRESETESSKNPTRRRSKRTRKFTEHHQYYNHQNQDQENFKKLKFHKLSNKKSESWAEPEPVSSISDAPTEEDVAFCLMMLSRDKWKKKEKLVNEQEHEELEAEEETDESDEFKSCKTRTRGKYRCETCKKSFKSYQALGGHRASHRKIKVAINVQEPELLETENNAGPQKKFYECPYCYRVFSSGQALGGHKRSHLITGSAPPPPPPAAAATPVRSSTISNNFIDLNLPAPIDDDISQIELSAVSDAEFVNHVRR